MQRWLHDLSHSARLLVRSPAYAAITTLTLALGLGVTLAMFIVLDRLVLRPLPFPNPEHLVRLWESNPAKGYERFDVLPGTFLDWRERNTTFEALATYRTSTWLVTSGNEPERLRGAWVSSSFLTLLGVQPLLGRTLLDEGQAQAEPAREVVISHGLWERKYGRRPDILSQSFTIEGWATSQIVGVMPPGFNFPDDVEVWGREDLTRSDGRGDRWRQAIGRLRPDVALERGVADLQRISAQAALEHPATNAGWTAAAEGLEDVAKGHLRPVLLGLFAAVAALLLIACANVANVVLARAITRLPQTAVRVALGASRRDLLRLAFCESVLLTAVATGFGLLVADSLLDVVQAVAPAGLTGTGELTVDGSTVAFAAALAAALALLFAALPVVLASTPGLQARPSSASRTTSGSSRIRMVLLSGEIALTVMLLAGSGLLVRSFINLQRVDLGVDAENVWTTELAVPIARFESTPLGIGHRPRWEALDAFLRDTLDHMRGRPGIVAAALSDTQNIPEETPTFFRQGMRFGGTDGERWPIRSQAVTPDYFRVLGVPLVRGRPFVDADRAAPARLAGKGPAAAGVAIISESAARRYWPGRDPIGQPIALEGDSMVQYRTIVGVTSDLRRSAFDTREEPVVYVPLAQGPRFRVMLFVRTDPAFTQPALLRDDLRRFDPAVAVGAVRPYAQLLGEPLRERRFGMLLLSAFAAVALALAAAGLYAVVTFVVSQRQREFGLRVALGARPRDVAHHVVGRALAPICLGGAVGLAGALAAGRIASAMLFGVPAVDGVVLGTTGALIVLASIAALFAPVREAVRIDPVVALRLE